MDFLRSLFPAAPGDDTDLDITTALGDKPVLQAIQRQVRKAGVKGAVVWASHRGQATTLKVALPGGERHYEVRRTR